MPKLTPEQVRASLTLAVVAALIIGGFTFNAYQRAMHPTVIVLRSEH